jgi:hypothetical protein
MKSMQVRALLFTVCGVAITDERAQNEDTETYESAIALCKEAILVDPSFGNPCVLSLSARFGH